MEMIEAAGVGYQSGYLDGQEAIVDEILDVVDMYGNWEDAIGNIKNLILRKKEELESA